MKIKIIIAILTFLTIAAENSYADTLYLKNTRNIHGIIKKETKDHIVLDIGFGTVTFPKSDIERIEYSQPEEKNAILKNWKEKYAGTGRWVPEGAKDLFENFKAVERKRTDAISYKQQNQLLMDEISDTEKLLSDLYIESENLNNRLKNMSKTKDVLAYNNLVAQVNTATAKIGKLLNESKRYARQKRESDKTLSGYMSDYMNSLSSFTTQFEDKYASLKKTGIKKDDEGFYKWMEEELATLSNDFERREIQFSQQQAGIVVNTVLNNKVRALLVVDTGASLVVISRKVANQLGVTGIGQANKIEVVLADGSTTKATPVILDSVEVGGSRVNNVFAAILEEPPDPNIDGLLGMSFLGNFLVKIDSKDDKLILEKFNPK